MENRTWVAVLIPFFFLLFVQGADGGESDYIGSKKCWKCHMKEYKSWQKTTMAQSLDLLKPGERSREKREAGLDPGKDYRQDQECLGCHVTGLGKTGGFVNADQTPELAGVGCEACHGAGGDYTREEHMSIKNREYKLADLIEVGLVSPVSEEMCTSCHNDQSPFFEGFDFQERKDEGLHQIYPLKFKHD